MPKSIDMDYIITKFSEYKNGNNIVCSSSTFRDIIKNNQNLKKKRSKCSYFVWLGENRDNIRTKYFNDFDDIVDWSVNNKQKYYIQKNLPIEKIEKPGRPRIVSLITTKAGIIWKSLSDEVKETYKQKAEELKDDCEIVEVKPQVKRKRGRPKKPINSNNITDAVVDKYKKNKKNKLDKSNYDIKVEEIMYNGKKYWLDINTQDIYDPDTEEIVGKSKDSYENADRQITLF